MLILISNARGGERGERKAGSYVLRGRDLICYFAITFFLCHSLRYLYEVLEKLLNIMNRYQQKNTDYFLENYSMQSMKIIIGQ